MGLFSSKKRITLENKFARIVDKTQCMSTINTINSYEWKDLDVKLKAGKSEWLKTNFYPTNKMVGEIVDSFRNQVMAFDIYILKIDDKYYVPMSESGIEFISKEEYDMNSFKTSPILDGETKKKIQKYDNFKKQNDLIGKKHLIIKNVQAVAPLSSEIISNHMKLIPQVTRVIDNYIGIVNPFTSDLLLMVSEPNVDATYTKQVVDDLIKKVEDDYPDFTNKIDSIVSMNTKSGEWKVGSMFGNMAKTMGKHQIVAMKHSILVEQHKNKPQSGILLYE